MAYDIAGLVLGPNKRELVSGRLTRRLRVLGVQSFAEYRVLLEGADGEAERVEMINALTTNLTSFFREPHHFTFLANELLGSLPNNGGATRLRIWSSACSSGEEPYSIAMTMHKAMLGRGSFDARILATDIDTQMIETGLAACYDMERARTIPAAYANLYRRTANGTFEMTEEIKKLIAFKPLNLLGPWPMGGPFNVVFCRNVIIYFDQATQRRLFQRFADIIAPGGFLFLGHSETLLEVNDRFEHLGRTVYRKLR